MVFWLLISLPFVLPVLIGMGSDPGPGLWVSRGESRSFVCQRMARADAHTLRPDSVGAGSDKNSYFDENYFQCIAPVFAEGERPPQAEALLTELTRFAGDAVSSARDAFPDVQTWLADAQLNDVSLGRKVSMALKVELKARDARVNDAVPPLRETDLLEIQSAKGTDAFPLACVRLTQRAALGKEAAILTAVSLHEADTRLHAGVCREGRWTWLF